MQSYLSYSTGGPTYSNVVSVCSHIWIATAVAVVDAAIGSERAIAWSWVAWVSGVRVCKVGRDGVCLVAGDLNSFSHVIELGARVSSYRVDI